MIDPRLERARQLNQDGRPVEAEPLVREVLGERPRDDWGLRVLATVLSSQGRHDEALEAVTQCVRENPEGAEGWMMLSTVRRNRREGEEAVAAAERSVACAPHDPETHYALARAYLTFCGERRPRKPFDALKALPAADEAVRRAPSVVRYRVMKADALTSLDRDREARDEYRTALSLDPGSWTALAGLARLIQRRHPIAAARYYATAQGLRPHTPAFRTYLMDAAMFWLYRMEWIWLWGGLALVAVRLVAPDVVVWAGLVGLAGSCAVGTWLLLRHIPRGSRRVVASSAPTSLGLLAVRLAASISVAAVAALARPPLSVSAAALLVVLVLLEWKVNFTAVALWIRAWPQKRLRLRTPPREGSPHS